MSDYLLKIGSANNRKAFTFITGKLDMGSSGFEKKISSIKFFLNENISQNYTFWYRKNEDSAWTEFTNPVVSDTGEYYKYKISLKVRTIQIKVAGLAAGSEQNSQLNGISIIYRKFTGR